jgi:hypothetical protein
MNIADPRPFAEIVTPSRRSLLALSWLNFFLAGIPYNTCAMATGTNSAH